MREFSPLEAVQPKYSLTTGLQWTSVESGSAARGTRCTSSDVRGHLWNFADRTENPGVGSSILPLSTPLTRPELRGFALTQVPQNPAQYSPAVSQDILDFSARVLATLGISELTGPPTPCPAPVNGIHPVRGQPFL